jgi:hypothetical protein
MLCVGKFDALFTIRLIEATQPTPCSVLLPSHPDERFDAIHLRIVRPLILQAGHVEEIRASTATEKLSTPRTGRAYLLAGAGLFEYDPSYKFHSAPGIKLVRQNRSKHLFLVYGRNDVLFLLAHMNGL